MNDLIYNKVKEAYRTRFGIPEVSVRAPGRINLIGEHTDYNEGFVLPASVSHSIYFSVGTSGDPDQCNLVSLDFDKQYSFKISEMAPLPPDSWQNYILGVVSEILKIGRELKGFNLVFSGDVPRGSGMSSSAALECGTCLALSELFKLDIPKLDIVKMSQKAEHNYAGVMCGIMDQFASTMGKKDQALRLDCRSLDYRYFPIDLKEYGLLLCNSNVSHSLASSQYNVRRQQCEEGVTVLRAKFPDVNSLRDATIQQLEVVKEKMDPKVYLRCKYIIEENERVARFTQALNASDLVEAGMILKRAQKAMKEEYEITCPEIDFMADFANDRADVLGARMMGGGFGGCTLNIVQQGAEELFINKLSAAYQAKFDKDITPIEVHIDDGVERV